MTQTKQDEIVEAVCSSIKAFDDKILENMLKTIVGEKAREAIRLTAKEFDKKITEVRRNWCIENDTEIEFCEEKPYCAFCKVLNELEIKEWLSEGEEK